MSLNSHDSGSTPASDPAQAPDPRAWVAPLISTLLTLPMGLVALFVGGLTPMACDSCDGAAADRFDASFPTAWTVLWIGLVLTLIVVAASCAVPHRIRPAALRVRLALTAPAPAVATFGTLIAPLASP